MTAHLQLFMILGAIVLLLIIFALLKRGLMSVKYSLLWLALAVGLVIAAAFPYVVYVLRDLLDIEMPVNLSHSFKREYGASPIDYLMKRRITEAKALLTSTDFSLTQIAEQIGFRSLAYFSKCFRKVEDISPNEYRKTAARKAPPGNL